VSGYTLGVPLGARYRYALAGEPGLWRYVGQAWYVDESTGERVEHDHVRMAQVRDGEPFEVWVSLDDVTGVAYSARGAETLRAIADRLAG
jgi:hypothetical protein